MRMGNLKVGVFVSRENSYNSEKESPLEHLSSSEE
jgi:hypothetical protein